MQGPIAPESLGLVLPHEHILSDVTPPELKAISDREVEITLENVHEIRYHWIKHYGNHVLNDREVAADEVARFGSAGGGTIVELTVFGIRPDPIGLRHVSIASGVPIVAGIGFYIESFAGELVGARDVEGLALEMIRGVREGVAGTDVRAGIIGEIGVSDPC